VRRTEFLSRFWVRLTLAQALTSAVLASVLFGGLYWATVHYAQRQLHDEIAGDATALASDTEVSGRSELEREIARRVALPGNTGWYALVGPAGQTRVGNLSPGLLAPGWHELSVPTPQESHPPPLLVQVLSLADGYRLAVGRDTAKLRELEEFFAGVFGWVLLLAVLAGLGGALAVGRAVNRRTSVLHAVTAAVEAGDLDQRVALSPRGDEFDLIGRDVNDMLDHIGRLLQRLRQVSLDVAHDLRTPLSRLRQRLDSLQQPDLTPQRIQAEAQRATADLDAVLATFDALLRLARLEEGSSRAAFRDVDLSGLLHNLAEVYAPVADDAGQSLAAEVAPGLVVHGDRELLVQMLVNVIENAIRHTPPGTRVTLRAGADAAGLTLEVTDDGPGIAAADRERAVQPLVRLDSSRGGEGSGMGLALAKAIAELHDGRLELRDAVPGLCVHIALGPPPGEPAARGATA